MPHQVPRFRWLVVAGISFFILIGGLACKEESESEPPLPLATLTINSPALGTVWSEGQTVNFTWNSSDLDGSIGLELCRNYPSSAWESIIDDATNDGAESWTVTPPATPSARVRITSASYPTIGDTTDNFIAIVSATTRAEAIPDDAVKITPVTDLFPPILHSNLWSEPVPLLGPVNTAGVEDSPVITPDGQTLFFFFTPDANVPDGLKASDGISGVWGSQRIGGEWSEPERVLLYTGDALDSPLHVQGDILWFGSARIVPDRINVYTVPWRNGSWADWQDAGSLLNDTYDVGQLALTNDGLTMYFDRLNDSGTNYELFKTVFSNTWSLPVTLNAAINTAGHEGQPCLTPDNTELWFMRDPSGFGYTGPSIWRSVASDTSWSNPEEVLSNICGDVAIDAAGNLYFTHVFLDDTFNKIEADIYVCYRQ